MRFDAGRLPRNGDSTKSVSFVEEDVAQRAAVTAPDRTADRESKQL